MTHQPVTAAGEGGPVPRSIETAAFTMEPPTDRDVVLVAELLGVEETSERPREVIGGWSEHWERKGWGTWVARQADGVAIGFVGLQDQEDFVRLTTRFVVGTGPERARRALRAAMAHCIEWLPDLPVRMRVSPEDTRTRELVTGAGLTHVPELDHDVEGETWQVFELPYVRVVDRMPPRAREAVLRTWVRVNDEGGAVGFAPGTHERDVDLVLDGYVAMLERGEAAGVALNSALGDLLGFGFVVHERSAVRSHGVTLERVMVDPERRHTNFGSLLMAGLHRTARERGAELVTLDYRGGTGLGDFYERQGYSEVGRVPGAIRLAADDDRDSVIMVKAL